MANLGSNDTAIEGADFSLPAGAQLDEDGGDLVIRDSGGSIVFRRDEAIGVWVTDSVSADEATIGQSRVEYDERTWVGSKQGSVIAPGDNPDATLEQYVPAPTKINGTYKMWVKSNESPTVARLYDGGSDPTSWTVDTVTWSSSDSNMSFTDVVGPCAITDNDTHLYYRAEGGTDDGSIGHASGADASSLSPDSNNPLTDAIELQTELNIDSISGFTVNDVIVLPDGTRRYYGICTEANSDFDYVWYGEGSDYSSITPIETIAGPLDFPRTGTDILDPNVFWENGVWYMTVGVGVFDTAAADGMEVYCLIGDGTSFTPVSGISVDTGAGGDFDDGVVYGGSHLKKQDGKFYELDRYNDKVHYYYNAQDSADTNDGEIGHISYDAIPSADALPRINRWILNVFGDGTKTTTSTSNNNNLNLVTTTGNARATKLLAQLKDQNSTETAHCSFERKEWNLSGGGQGQSEVTRTGGGYAFRLGSAEILRPKDMQIQLELWTSGGTADLLSADLIMYDGRLTESVR